MGKNEKFIDQIVPPFNYGQTFNGINYPAPDIPYKVDVPWNTVMLLNEMFSGEGPSERVGRSIHCKSVHLNLVLSATLNQGFGDDTPAGGEICSRPGPVRLALVWDSQPNGNFPDAKKIWNIPVGLKLPICGFRNLTTPHRFKILWDETFCVGGFQGYNSSDNGDSPNYDMNPYYGNQSVLLIQKHIKLKGDFQTVYDGNIGSSATVREGGLFLLCCGVWSAFQVDYPPLVTYWPMPTLQGNTRLKYTDGTYSS